VDGLEIVLGANMIGAIVRSLDTLLGRGEAAATVPPLDGALRPNRRLDEAKRLSLPGVDCLAVVRGQLFASAGNGVFRLEEEKSWRLAAEYRAEVACIAAVGDGLAVALANGDIVIDGGRFHRFECRVAKDIACITAMAASDEALYVANGSATNSATDWQRDLLERNASGSVWRIDLNSGRGMRIADGLAWPAGLAIDASRVVCSEAWKHRLIRIDTFGQASPETLLADLPGYPGRLSPGGGNWWLAVFAPRNQLVEFVLREPTYRKRMMAEVEKPFWVAPKLRAGRSFYEPLQGGGVKHLGILKPWAPTMSAGLCVRLDTGFQPRLSLHSRADGKTHGVTSVAEYNGHVFAAARGDDVVAVVSLDELGDNQ